jgi:hypothetical protein
VLQQRLDGNEAVNSEIKHTESFPLNSHLLNSDYLLVLRLKPLVDGLLFYKKFSLRQSMNVN